MYSCTTKDTGDASFGRLRGSIRVVSWYAPGPQVGSLSGKENANAQAVLEETWRKVVVSIDTDRASVLSTTAISGNPVELGVWLGDGLDDAEPEGVAVQLFVASPDADCDDEVDSEGVPLGVPVADALFDALAVPV